MAKVPAIPFFVHSTFRNFMGNQVKPYGLEWGLDGDSYMTFVPADLTNGKTMPNLDAPETRRGIVEAYNRWASSKELEFKTVDDVEDVILHNDGIHIQVEWRELHRPCRVTKHDDMEALLKQDAATNGGDPAEVWVNGVYEGLLNGEMSLFPLILAIKRANGPGTQLSFCRYEGLIRIEKYFRGMLRKNQVFEHVMDNLITLEDVEVLDSKTLIGTSTLNDWIMGGNLTSRLHVEELDNGDIKFVRPLYNDDIHTADRRFGLFKGRDDDKIALVQKELHRLRFLATLKHPFSCRKITKQAQKEERTLNNFGTIIVDRVPQEMDASVSTSVILDEAEASMLASMEASLKARLKARLKASPEARLEARTEASLEASIEASIAASIAFRSRH